MTMGQQTMAYRSNPVHQIFCMDSKLRRVFIFQWLKELQKSDKQYFIACENYEIQVPVCTSQGFLGAAWLICWWIIYGCIHYSNRTELLQQRPQVCRAQNTSWSIREVCWPQGLQQWWLQCVVQTTPQAFENHSAWLVCEAGLGGVFFSAVFEQQLLKWMGCWLWQYRSKVEAQPRAGHAGDSEKSEIKASAPPYPLPPTHVPPKTCIITMIFYLISACKQTAGWEINKFNCLVRHRTFLERLDNKYFRLAGHIISAVLISTAM